MVRRRSASAPSGADDVAPDRDRSSRGGVCPEDEALESGNDHLAEPRVVTVGLKPRPSFVSSGAVFVDQYAFQLYGDGGHPGPIGVK
jgi:hypothetical protein